VAANRLRPAVEKKFKVRFFHILFALAAAICSTQVGMAQAPINAFVVSANNTISRFDTSGNPLPANGQTGATFVPAIAQSTVNALAYGPDGNLYVLYNGTGSGISGVQSFDGLTGAPRGNFLNDPSLIPSVAPSFGGLTFDSQGNLYVGVRVLTASGTTTSSINRYCGPMQTGCSPGTPLGLTSVSNDATYVPLGIATASILHFVFGPDDSLYVTGLGALQRFCGPTDPATCPPGTAFPSAGHTGALYANPGNALHEMAFGPDNNLYVADVGFFGTNNQVFIICGPNSNTCAPGSLIGGFLSPPLGPTEEVLGIDFGPDGNLYAGDVTANNILRFNGPNCSPAPCAGAPNPAPNAIVVANVPGGIANQGPFRVRFPHSLLPPPPVPNPGPLALLVIDSGKVLRYDGQTGNPLPGPNQGNTAVFIPGGSGGLVLPRELALGPDGNLYVADSAAGVLRFDASTGTPLGVFVPPGAGGMQDADLLAFGPDSNLYVADLNQQEIFRYDGRSGTFMDAFFTNGTFITSFAFGPDANLYALSNLGSILRFCGPQDSACALGDPIDVFASTPFLMHDLMFGPDANLYVIAGGQGVLRFDGRTGDPLGTFVEEPLISPTFSFDFPSASTFGPDGNLYLSAFRFGHSGVLRYNGMTGTFIDQFVPDASGGLANPFRMLFLGVPAAGVSGAVFRDSPAAGNELVGVQVQVLELLGGVLPACPFSQISLGLAPCPSVLTNAGGRYAFSNLPASTYLITAWPPASLNFFPNSMIVTLPNSSAILPNQNIVLLPPTPIPNGTTVSPSNLVPVQGGNVPVVFSDQDFTIQTHACSFGNGSFTITDTVSRQLASGQLTEGPVDPSGTTSIFTGQGRVPSPFKGAAMVTISVNCAFGQVQTQTFLLYIDPSGSVVDDVTGQGIPGATVTLFRSDTATGAFVQVPAGSALMSLSNRNNPDQTNAAGRYGWDVVPGFYSVQASAPGYTCDPNSPPHGFTCVNGVVKSGVFTIPPAVTDLHLPLHRIVQDTTPPVLSLPGNMTVTATSAGSSVATFTATAIDLVDGNVPVTCSPSSGSLFAIGTTTVNCSASDAHTNTSTGSFTMTVLYNICPLYTVTAKKSGSTYPIKVQLCTASGANLSSSGIPVHVTGAAMISTGIDAPVADSGNANPDMDFRYDPTLAGYIFNLSLKGYATGTYDLLFRAGSDPSTHRARYEVK
jgi:HYR domain-containing protein